MHMSKQDAVKIAVETTPAAIAATAGPVFGLQWHDLPALLGSVFLVLQIGYLVWKWRRDFKRERRGLAPRESGFAATGGEGDGHG